MISPRLTLAFCLGLTVCRAHGLVRSEVDELLTIRTISLLPTIDNADGIYSRGIDKHLTELLAKNNRFETGTAAIEGRPPSPDELSEDLRAANEVAGRVSGDAFLSPQALQGPRGLSVRLYLFLKKDGKLLAKVEQSDLQRTDMEGVRKEVSALFTRVLGQVPYDGLVLSRQGTRVTVNIGSVDGVVKDQVLPVVQIISANRHPKFNFLVSTEKIVLGKIKLIKVEDTLSFGRIQTETEANAIQPLSKIAGLQTVTYKESSDNPAALKPEAPMTYGENPTEWVPTRKPSFGQVGARFGLGTFNERVSRSAGPLQADSSFYPFIGVEGELWLTPIWSLHASLRQGLLTTDNPVSGGSPSDLNHRVSVYDLLAGYNLRLGASLDSPRIELLGGFSSFDKYVDSSTPDGLTSRTYSGIKLGVAGQYPVSEGSPYSLGANLFFFFDADLSESPAISGGSKNSITQFGFFVDKQLRTNLKARANLDFEALSSNHSGAGVNSASQRHTLLSGGLYYMF
jgi:hypothetical protein